MKIIILRTPWPADFPDVVIHQELRVRNQHPNFLAAKSGNAGAALALARDLLTDIGLEQIAAMLGTRKPFVLPVAAIETGGFNAIPDAIAQEVAEHLALPVLSGSVVQSNKVAHTRAGGWHHLVTPATFTGTVVPGGDYLLVDDHIGFGGTLANLRGYVEANGGHVIGMTALTETGGGREIAIRPETLSML